jgi:hypothetical protein
MKSYVGENHTIYKHTNKTNGKCYVGQTNQEDLTRRWCGGHGYNGCRYFYNAILKNGWDAFTHEILETGLSKREVNIKEKEYIQKYKSNNNKYGYNIQSGGHDSGELSDEGRESLRKRFSGANSPIATSVCVFDLDGNLEGKFPTVSAAAKYLGTIRSTVSGACSKKSGTLCKKICRYYDDVGDIKKLPKEMIVKVGDMSKLCKKVSQYSLDGKFIATHQSVKSAAQETWIPSSQISGCFSGKRSSAGGFIWVLGDKTQDSIDPYDSLKNVPRGSSHYSARPVCQYDRNTGKKLTTYATLKDAWKSVGAAETTFRHALEGDSPTCKGFIWRYEDENLKTVEPHPKEYTPRNRPSMVPVKVISDKDRSELGRFNSMSAAARFCSRSLMTIQRIVDTGKPTDNGYIIIKA